MQYYLVLYIRCISFMIIIIHFLIKFSIFTEGYVFLILKQKKLFILKLKQLICSVFNHSYKII